METEPIAVVGVGCTLPGSVHTLEEARAVFEEGRDCIREVPPERWDVDALYDPDPLQPGRTYVRHGGFVDDVDRFDAAFFGVSDVEAVHMDPQQRILLQTVWHALENAGQNPEELSGGNTGVFLALMSYDYSMMKNRGGLEKISAYEAMDTDSISAGRIAHFLGLRGPCLTVDTACSGSLVALHLARQSILTGECDTAIVAGANAILAPNVHISFSKLGLFSRAGQCRTFDAEADGYVRSEGCVAVLLKRQSLAEEQGDPILASVVGTALNHTGRTRTLTTPDGSSQQRVIRAALTGAGVQPGQVDYVEAHGTGTPVGDPIEMDAIIRTYGAGRPTDQPLYVSSGKSNVGHIEAGAGLLGVVRAALSLDRETIYPSLHLNRLHPKIDLTGTPVTIPAEAVSWPRRDTPRMAAVNSFGYSGTNAHALLREAPLRRPAEGKSPTTAGPRADELLVLSAKSADSLQELAGRWADFLSRTKQQELPAAVFTAAAGRASLRHRIAVTGRTGGQLANSLRQWQTGRTPAAVSSGHPLKTARVAFAFSGQGTQYPRMARELYTREPAFAEAIDRCAAAMEGTLDVPLRELLFGGGDAGAVTEAGAAAGTGGKGATAGTTEGAGPDIHDTRYAQPALFAVEYGLAELLRSWGVRPTVVTGHSIGEVVAACVGGMLTLEDAARFSVQRGRVMAELPRGGRMLAISTDPDTVTGWLAGREQRAGLAAVNGPRSVVVSGAADAVEEIAELAAKARVDTAWLRTSHAFHSPLMDPALPQLRQHAAELKPSRPDVTVLSGATAQPLTGEEGPEHWTGQAREAVRFHDAVGAAVDAGCTVVVEIGPHAALTPHVAEAFAGRGVTAVPTLDRDGQDVRRLLTAAGTLFTAGAELTVCRLYRGDAYQRTPDAPQYPFRKDRYWWGDAAAPTETATATRSTAPAGPPATAPTSQASPAPSVPTAATTARTAAIPAPRAETSVHDHGLLAAAPWSDHRVHGATVFPATGYLTLAVRAFTEANAGAATNAAARNGTTPAEPVPPLVLSDLEFTRPLVLVPDTPTTARVTLAAAEPGGGRRFTVTGSAATGAARNGTPAGTGGGWSEHCQGTIVQVPPTERAGRLPDALREEAPHRLSPAQLYGMLRDGGLEHGFHFATVRELRLADPGREEALGRITAVPDGAPAEPHPYRLATMLDGALQLAAALFLTPAGADAAATPAAGALLPGGYIPVALRRLTLPGPLPGEVWAHVRRRPHDAPTGFVVDLRLTDADGRIVADLEGVEFRHAGALAGGDLPDPAEAGARGGRSRRELLDALEPLGPDERRQEVIRWLSEEVRETLGKASEEMEMVADGIDPSLALLEIGLDSLRVTALQRRIQEKLEFRYKAMEALDYQTIEGLAEFLLERVLALEPATATV
ncbi:polyketide synthase 12/myxalamid-type polyketide synthase MxaE and MxaD [Actinacidiphila yanglinensis]|uniref:Polyketide synthase 12/myxalamid-type polyketide synthase MxaE and MxaD n=1 Tax=Actinacidiphila yanglinensis TaxID=310779 RepID=A0A1H5SXE5_9ACTN|nr:type I polyketide synthase [Actinacidiphila yanglinensis]SEF54608.1 polyketide synthase 12/myxalamid-type polyketide synthase MxaE and MxaD [Actinacidiphila yanglinensis]